MRSATEIAPKSLLVAPDRCMYRLAIIATCAAGVDSPCGYENELSTPVESAFSTSRICTWPNRIPERSLKARYATTQSATPVATAIAACWTVAHAAPPPWWILEKNFSSPMPVARAMATSVLESIVNVTMPSTSAGVSPASSSASSTASDGEPQLAAPGVLGEVGGADPDDRRLPGQLARHQAFRSSDRQRRSRGDHVIAEAVAANDFQRDQAVLDGGHLTLERHRVVGVPRHAQPQPDRLDHRVRSRPVGDVALHQTGVGEDVDEDVLGPLGLRLVPVVVDVLVVAGGDRGRHDERRVAVERELGQLRAHLDCRRAHASRLPCVERPGRTRIPVGEVDIRCANRHSDLHGRRVDVAELAEHPHALFEFDERDDERQRAAGHLRRVVHDEAEHRALAAGDDVVGRLSPCPATARAPAGAAGCRRRASGCAARAR